MRKVLSLVIVIISAIATVSAQARQERQQYFEPKSAGLKVEPPARAAAKEEFYPETSFSYPAEDFKPGVVRVGPRTTYLKEGLRTDEVIRLLGRPSSISERKDKDSVVTTYEFKRGEGRILIAEFLSGVLVRTRTETRPEGNLQAAR